MSDPTPTPTPSPAPQTSTRAQWPISKEVTTELDLAEHVLTAAQRDVYAPALADEDIDATAIQNLTDAITAADDLVFQATGARPARKSSHRPSRDSRTRWSRKSRQSRNAPSANTRPRIRTARSISSARALKATTACS